MEQVEKKVWSTGLFIVSHDSIRKGVAKEGDVEKEPNALFLYAVTKAGHNAKTGEWRNGAHSVEALVHGKLNTFDLVLFLRKKFRKLALVRFIASEIGFRLALEYLWRIRDVVEIPKRADARTKSNSWERVFFVLYIPPERLYEKELIKHVRSTSLGIRRVGEYRGKLFNFDRKRDAVRLIPGRGGITNHDPRYLHAHKETLWAMADAFKIFRD